MAHNLSESRRLARLMEQPLEMWRGWVLYARCATMHPTLVMPVEEALEKPDWPKTVGGLRRLRCGYCNEHANIIAFCDRVGGKVWETVLAPPHLQTSRGGGSSERVEWWRGMKF